MTPNRTLTENTPPDARRARRRRRRVRNEDRKRAPRACRRCKNRKNKCIGTSSGVCERCQLGSHACIFDKAADLLDEEEGDYHDDASKPSRSITHESSLRAASAKDKQMEAATPPPPQDAILEDGLEHPRRLLTDVAVSERLVWPGFLSRLRYAFSLDPRPAPEEQEVICMQASIARQPPQPGELRRLRNAIAGFPPRPIADFLLSVCIEHGTDAFFYFDQATFAAELDQFYSDDSCCLRHDSSFVCLALATFALGSQWTTLARPEKDRGQYALPEDTDPGRIFFDHARTLVPDILDRQCVRSVQAAFVLSVYLAPASAITAAYVYMGLALRKAVSLGLHRGDADDHHVTESDTEFQRRLWWAIYSLERTTAVKLNRPRSISQDSITARLPSPLFSMDSKQRFDNVQHQLANAKLMLILDRVSDVSMHRKDGAISLQQYLADLTAWKRALPMCLKLENVHPRSSSYKAVVHLYLNYYVAQITVLKISLVTAVRARLRSALARIGESGEGRSEEISQDIKHQCGVCTRAARKVLELFKALAATKNVTRFSFTDFQGCSIATIIILVAGILDRDSAYRDTVEFGIDCLCRMVGGNLTAKLGIRFVEAVRAIADEAREKLCRAEEQHQEMQAPVLRMASSDIEEHRQLADYERWAAWLAAAESLGSERSNVASLNTGVVERPGAGDIDPALLPHNLAAAVPTSSWAQNASLHEGPTPSLAEPLAQTFPDWGITHHQQQLDFNAEFAAASWNDDRTYLMGLTGLDVLSFADPLG